MFLCLTMCQNGFGCDVWSIQGIARCRLREFGVLRKRLEVNCLSFFCLLSFFGKEDGLFSHLSLFVPFLVPSRVGGLFTSQRCGSSRCSFSFRKLCVCCFFSDLWRWSPSRISVCFFLESGVEGLSSSPLWVPYHLLFCFLARSRL